MSGSDYVLLGLHPRSRITSLRIVFRRPWILNIPVEWCDFTHAPCNVPRKVDVDIDIPHIFLVFRQIRQYMFNHLHIETVFFRLLSPILLAQKTSNWKIIKAQPVGHPLTSIYIYIYVYLFVYLYIYIYPYRIQGNTSWGLVFRVCLGGSSHTEPQEVALDVQGGYLEDGLPLDVSIVRITPIYFSHGFSAIWKGHNPRNRGTKPITMGPLTTYVTSWDDPPGIFLSFFEKIRGVCNVRGVNFWCLCEWRMSPS